MTINRAMDLLVAELEADEMPAPLAQRLTLGHVWIDLARLAGEPVPAHVAALLDEPTRAAPLRLDREAYAVSYRAVTREPWQEPA